MMVKNGPVETLAEDAGQKCLGGCLAFALVGAVILAFVLFWLYMESRQCQVKPWRCKDGKTI
jgi:hypothetical protein